MRSISKDKGWDYLTSHKEEGSVFEDDGSWEMQNSDGSGSYFGADGSWGCKYADGSASFYGSDGSWGYKNSDGSVSYYGTDGTWGYKNADGTGSYFSNDDEKGACEDLSNDYSDDEEEESFAESNGKIIDSAIAAFGIAAAAKARQERELEEQKQREHQAELNKKRRAKQRRRKKFCKKHRKGIVVFVCIILLSILAAIGYYQYSKLIPTKYSDEELLGLNYTAVKQKLENAGFSNVSVVKTEDLTLEQIEQDNKVFEIKISDDTDFEKDDKYAYDTKIVIQYHALIPVCSPVSAEEIDEQNYLEILNQFKKAGFANVVAEPIYDVVLGWFDSDGEIESITIKGKESFYEGERFRPDDKVVIKYHTFKKNKPKE